MKTLQFRFVRYCLGLFVALIALSNCFGVFSNSSGLTTASPSDESAVLNERNVLAPFYITPDRVQFGLHSPAPALDRGTKASLNSLGELVTRSATVSFLEPQATTTVTATKTHMLPAGDTQADPGDILTYSVVIANTGGNAALNVNFTDMIDPNTTTVGANGSLIVSPIAVNDSFNTIGNVNIVIPVGQGVILNDLNPNGPTSQLEVTQVNATAVPGGGSATTTTTGGSVTMSSDGSFTYNPNAGFRGPDTFSYTLGNGTGKTDTATVTIAINSMIWFVNSGAGTNGDGRLTSPFNCLTGTGCFDPAASDAANDIIFLYSSGTDYIGGLTLLAGQFMIGQGASQSILTIPNPDLPAPSGTNQLPATGGVNPTVVTTAAGTNAVNLGTNNEIWGLTFGNTTGADINGTSYGTLKVRDTTLNGNGQALNLSTGTLDAIFQSISSTNSASTGITVNAAGGSLSVTGTTSVTNSASTAVNLTNNTGTITFAALNITTTTTNQAGLVATDNTNTITTTSGGINTGTGTAVNITRSSGTTPLVVSLTSVSSSGGTGNGIILSNTSGSFTVVGTGTASSGGTIANKTGGDGSTTQGSGIFLNNATNVSLDRMQLNGFQNFGIRGLNVTGFTLDNTIINGTNGTNSTGPSEEGAVRFDGLFGSASISNSTLGGNGVSDLSFSDNLRVINGSGTLNRLTITNTNFGKIGINGNNGLTFTANNNGTVMHLTVQDSFFTNAIGSLASITSNQNSTMDLVIRRNKFSNNNVNQASGGGGLAIQGGAGAPAVTYDLSCNTLRDSVGIALLVAKGNGSGAWTGSIINNTVGVTGVALSGSTQASGIKVKTTGTNTHTTMIRNNVVRQTNEEGIFLQNNDGSSTLNASVFGNLVAEPGAFSFAGLNVDVGAVAGDTSIINVVVGSVGTAGDKNDFSAGDPANFSDVNLSRIAGAGTQLNLSRNGSAGATPAIVIDDNNLNPATTNTGVSGTVNLVATLPATPPAVAGCILPASVGSGVSAQSEMAAQTSEAQGDDTEIVSQDPLAAAKGQNPEEDKNIAKLTQEELNWMVQAALVRWEQHGIAAEDMARLRAVTFAIGELSAGRVTDFSSTPIKIDESGAGYGWFFDQTPTEDSEFDVPVLDKERQTTEMSPAHGRMDLLTVVMRELGQVYLQDKKRVPRELRPLMEGTLSPGVRRMPVFNVPDRSTSRVNPGGGQSVDAKVASGAPSQQKSDSVPSQPKADSSSSLLGQLKPAVFNPSADLMTGSYGGGASRKSYATSARRVAFVNPFSGETVTKSLGTIPVGESVTIMFQVTIDNPFPAGVCTVTNPAPGSGANVTGTNFNPVTIAADVTTVFKALTLSPCPANITQGTDPNQCTAVVTYTEPTADGCPVPTVTCAPASGTAFATGTTTVTCTASNAPGTADDVTCTFTVTVDDTQAPTITCPANIITDTDPGVCTAVETFAPTTTDNCPLPPNAVVCTPASGTAFPKGTTTVNCTVTDGAGLTANCSFTVTVNDTTPPTITCPANITVGNDPNQCSAVVNYPAPTVTDNCPSAGTPVCTPAAGTAFPIGTTTVSCTVSDGSGNPANCSFTVTVNDTTNPVLTCPANVTQGTDAGVCTAVVNYAAPTVVDNCAGSITPVCTPASGSSFPTGTTTVNCTASDPGGNSGSCSFTVTVNDTINPTITCPADVVQGTDPNQCVAIVNYATPTGSDNCPLPPNAVVCTPPSGGSFPKGTTTVNCTVTDGAGLTATCSFTVTVNDTQAPVITCPANVVQGTAANQCSAVVTYANATATDNCPNVGTPVCNPPSGSSFPTGTTTVNCTVTDGSGNPANCSFTVTVNDTQNPTITCPANITVTTATACQVVSYPAPTVSDNCPLPPNAVVCNPPSGFCFPPGATTVNCTVTDGSGNMASCSFTVSVVPCVITCPANITQANDENQCGAVVTFTPATSAGCGTVTCSPPSGSFFAKGTTTVTCATQAGPSCSFTVTVNDTQPPTITQTTNVVELWPPNHTYRTVNVASLVTGVSDNCDPGGTSLPDPLIKQVTSDEPDNIAGNADGNTTKDIVIAANCKSVQLRAERNQNLNGRVYTITLRLRDSSGNLRTVTRKVVVPKNQSGGGAIDSGTAVTKLSNCP